jgi:hypothetical protein
MLDRFDKDHAVIRPKESRIVMKILNLRIGVEQASIKIFVLFNQKSKIINEI